MTSGGERGYHGALQRDPISQTGELGRGRRHERGARDSCLDPASVALLTEVNGFLVMSELAVISARTKRFRVMHDEDSLKAVVAPQVMFPTVASSREQPPEREAHGRKARHRASPIGHS